MKPIEPIPRRPSVFTCREGCFVSHRYPPRYLILWAWNLEKQDFRLDGLPAWAVDAGGLEYDIEARANRPVNEQDCRLMLRTLLADRFKLVTREEDRTMDGFALEIAKNGPKFREVTDSEAPPNGPGFTLNGSPNQVFSRDLKGWTMAQLAQALSFGFTGLGRPVIDRTGLRGIYKIELAFRNIPDGDGPDIRTAVRDQLGLQLVPAKAPFKVLVVERIERPDPN